MYYKLIARIKAVFRVLVFRWGTPRYIAYSDAARETSGYSGWYEVRGRVVAFQRDQGAIQYVW